MEVQITARAANVRCPSDNGFDMGETNLLSDWVRLWRETRIQTCYFG